MKIKHDYTVAAIVARFQVDTLHAAHIELIQSVIDNHPKVFIFLGLSPTKGTINNPLDFQPRKQMILEAFPPDKYPNLTIGYIKDNPSDAIWSANLDNLIRDLVSPKDTVVLYGGRDSFITSYQGKFPTLELVSSRYVSGTEIRRLISEKPQAHPLFRAGAIWATNQRFPTVYATIDITVYDAAKKSILLARKPDENLLRFIGGFADPKDESFEATAVRELKEEAGIDIGSNACFFGLENLGSYKIDDWRYRKEADKIISTLYLAEYNESLGKPIASDDIAEVVWREVASLKGEDFVPQHRKLWYAIRNRLQNTTVKIGEGNWKNTL